MKKRVLAIALVTALVGSMLAGCGNSGTPAPSGSGTPSGSGGGATEQPLTLKLAHNLAEDHAVHIAMTAWAEEVKTQSNGSITIQIIPAPWAARPTVSPRSRPARWK